MCLTVHFEFQSEGSLWSTYFTLGSFSCRFTPLKRIVALTLDSFLLRKCGYVGMITTPLSIFLAFGIDQNMAPMSTASILSINYL